MSRLLVACGGAITFMLAACAQPGTTAVGVTDVAPHPAERALLAGKHAYENGQYPESEKQLNAALKAGLASPKDRAAANKHLAFIYCTSNRQAECEAAFRAAKRADPTFALSKSEAGHPVWGPIYRRIQ